MPEERRILAIDAINTLAAFVYTYASNKGFNKEEDYKPIEIDNKLYVCVPPEDLTVLVKLSRIALMHSELAEATEGIRAKDNRDDNSVEELADTVIRVLHYCGSYHHNLGEAIVKKMEKNCSREFMHGGKKA